MGRHTGPERRMDEGMGARRHGQGGHLLPLENVKNVKRVIHVKLISYSPMPINICSKPVYSMQFRI